MRTWGRRICAVLLPILLASRTGHAEAPVLPTLQAMRVMLQALSFQQKPQTGPSVMAVVYDPARPRSRTEAGLVAGYLGDLATDGMPTQPILVPQGDLAAAGGYTALYATQDADPALLLAAEKRHGTVCATVHIALVDQGMCTIGVQSDPVVMIVLSQSNAVAIGVRFATAFRMMVQER